MLCGRGHVGGRERSTWRRCCDTGSTGVRHQAPCWREKAKKKALSCHCAGSSTNRRACRNNTSSYTPARGHKGPGPLARMRGKVIIMHLENEQLSYSITPPLIQRQGEREREHPYPESCLARPSRGSRQNQQCHHDSLKFQSDDWGGLFKLVYIKAP